MSLGLTSLHLVIIQMALGPQNHRKDTTGLLLLHVPAVTFFFFLIPLHPQKIECDWMSVANVARKVFWDQ